MEWGGGTHEYPREYGILSVTELNTNSVSAPLLGCKALAQYQYKGQMNTLPSESTKTNYY